MILDQIAEIAVFVAESFYNLWPYLLFSIPLAVAVRLSNASQYVRRIFVTQPVVAILLATLVGAFSPFCACTVVPLITSLLIAGVPLGPVMAFWIASPTMDPEIFLLSVGMLGKELAVVRVAATLLLSLGAGYSAHWLEQQGYFKAGILRERKQAVLWSWGAIVQPLTAPIRGLFQMPQVAFSTAKPAALEAIPMTTSIMAGGCGESCSSGQAHTGQSTKTDFWRQALDETRDATLLVVKFMLLAFVLEALITLYVPQSAIVSLVGADNPLAILLSALIGIPVYTTNLTALPLISGLLDQGMLPGAGLAFLIAGPTTTMPAMAAVFGIAKPRVFALYALNALVGAVVLGYGYQALLAV